MNRRSYTRRDYAAGVLIAAAVVIVLTVRPWWDLLGFPLAALGCWLALTPARVATPQARGRVMPNPRGRVAPSPVTRAPGGGAILAAAPRPARTTAPAWRPVVVARTQGAPPWDAQGHPAPYWDQLANPYPPNRHPSLSAGAWLAGLERVAKGSADACPPGVAALEAAALEDELVMVATGEATEVGPEGWTIVQPTPRTPPRAVGAAAPIVLNMAAPPTEGPQYFNPIPARVPPRDWSALAGTAGGDLLAATQPTAHPFKYRAAAVAVEAPRDPLGEDPGGTRPPVRVPPGWAVHAMGACPPDCGWCGVTGTITRGAVGALEARQDEEQERLADEAEITAVHRTAEYAAELAEQDRDAADFIASREVAGFEWAAALARELEAERRGRQ